VNHVGWLVKRKVRLLLQFSSATVSKMEQRIDGEEEEEPCVVSNPLAENQNLPFKGLAGYCLNCRQTLTDDFDLDHHSTCSTQLLHSMVADAKIEYAEWQRFESEVPIMIQNQCKSIDDTADLAIEIVSKMIRAKAEELKIVVRTQKSLSQILQNQMKHLEKLDELCSLDSVQGNEFLQSLHQVAEKVPYPSPKNCGIFYPTIPEVVALTKFLFMGRVLGSLDDEQVFLY